MSIAESMLPEFDQEMAGTRKVLERIPNDKLEWRAHPKSNTIGWLGSHLADIPRWTKMMLETESLDLHPPGSEPHRTLLLSSRDEMLSTFDKNVREGREVLAATTDEAFFQPWTLLNGGVEIFTLPKAALVRSFVLNHMIHHRAWLCSYLRLNDIPVPGLYGPSGDE